MRRTIRSSIAHQAAIAALCLGWLLLLAAPASADDGSLLVDVPGDGVGFTHDASGGFLNVQRLYPGGAGSGVLDVRNTSAYDATLDLRAVDVVSQENGCLRPEMREPGEGCDADGGELGDWLGITVSREGADGRDLWHGDMAGLTAGAHLATLPAGATWRLRVTVDLPQAATNDTMTDSLIFGTRLTASSTAGNSTVAGPQVGATANHPNHASLVAGPHVLLPGTGTTVSLWMLVLDGLVLVVGASLVATALRGRGVVAVNRP